MDFTKLKVGDRVWIGERSYLKSGGIRTVIRTTPTLIILDKDWEYGRFRRKSGYATFGGMFKEYISGIATKAECAAWDQEQIDKANAATAKAQEEARIEAERARLEALFTATTEVKKEQWSFSDGYQTQKIGEWSVCFHCLTSDQVEALQASLTPDLLAALQANGLVMSDTRRRFKERQDRQRNG